MARMQTASGGSELKLSRQRRVAAAADALPARARLAAAARGRHVLRWREARTAGERSSRR